MTYNFKPQFIGVVERGEKTSTIRAFGKRKAPGPGTTLRLYTGMRTKQCRLLREVVCESCVSIHIADMYIAVGGRIINSAEADTLARRDGFINEGQLRDWFKLTHSLPFEGWLITWRNS